MDPAKSRSTNDIMEKLRLKFSQKPWSETMELVRLSIDKHSWTSSSKTSESPISICLEKIERTLHAGPLAATMNKLSLLSNRKGLNYYVSPSGAVCYITSKSFYIEIHLEKDGKVVDVRLAHPGKKPLTCEDLLQLLRMENFDAFGNMLADMLNIYQIPGSSETKSKVFAAFLALEKDLCSLSALSRTPGMDRVTEILCGKVGYLNPRSGGSPMNLEFYLSQYQILEEQLTPGLKIDGRKVLVIIGGADAVHRLPLAPSLVNSPTGGDGSPRFLPLTEVISAPLSACFFLMFYQNCPFPLSSSSIHKLQELTGLPVARLKPGPLHELIVQFDLSEKHPRGLITSTGTSSFIVVLKIEVRIRFDGTLDSSKYGCPKHTYFIDKGIEKFDMAGAMVKKIPFTHPKCVPDMIEVLRRQAAYNTLISSCVSETTECEDSSDLLHFDVFQQKATSFSVTFQHPLEENLACVMVDVLSSRDIICTLHTHSEDGALICSNDYLTRVLKRCMSIPVLMRAIFKKATQQKAEETSLSKD